MKLIQSLLIAFIFCNLCHAGTSNQADINELHKKMRIREAEAEKQYLEQCEEMKQAREKLLSLSNQINQALDEEIESQKLNPENKTLFNSIKPLADDAKKKEASCRSAQSKYSMILEQNYEYFKSYNPPETQPSPPRFPLPIQCFSTRMGNSISTTCY